MNQPVEQVGAIAVPQAWTLPGVGAYGTDVEVVSLDAYERLVQRCKSAEAAALIWGRKCIALEGGEPSKLADDDVIRALALSVEALRGDR